MLTRNKEHLHSLFNIRTRKDSLCYSFLNNLCQNRYRHFYNFLADFIMHNNIFFSFQNIRNHRFLFIRTKGIYNRNQFFRYRKLCRKKLFGYGALLLYHHFYDRLQRCFFARKIIIVSSFCYTGLSHNLINTCILIAFFYEHTIGKI